MKVVVAELEKVKAMEKFPVISVILPAYNAEKYIFEAVHSILNQTFTDFEIIIINDGSTDATLKILKEIQGTDQRVRLVSRVNKGLVLSLNEGIDLACGEWIARMDADDLALPYRFERQLEWLNQTGADICGSWVKYFGTADKLVLKHATNDDAIKMELLFGCPFAHPSVMIKTELVRMLRYEKAWEKCEDYDLWERAACAGWKMTNVPEVLLMYRQHQAQISNLAAKKQQELAQQIRRRYSACVSDSTRIRKDWLNEVLKLREPLQQDVDMNIVDAAITKLLEINCGEARSMIFNHAKRLYFRASSSTPDIHARWYRINRRFGEGLDLSSILTMWLINKFGIRHNDRSYEYLKRIFRFAARKV